MHVCSCGETPMSRQINIDCVQIFKLTASVSTASLPISFHSLLYSRFHSIIYPIADLVLTHQLSIYSFLPDGICPPLPYLSNSIPNSTTARLGSVVDFACDPGYSVSSSLDHVRITCETGLHWSAFESQCTRT